ncbi:MAG: ROK family transcriptional regulator [Gemmatimonadetes bacterium]|nr:ROK family transcriptional regulator [Gemmatimonadota bacterium]
MRKINTRSFRRATRSTTREINRQIVLNLVHEHQPISRAELARQMGVARGSVTPLVKDLLEEGLIYERSSEATARGRRPTLLYVRTDDRLAFGIDIRTSGTSILLGDFAGREIITERFPTLMAPAELVAELGSRVGSMVEKYSDIGEFEGIGLVVPGMVDRTTGVVLHAPTLHWRDVDLRGSLAAAVGMPVHIERDAVACAMAHMWLGDNGALSNNFVYLTVSDGVGTGLVVNGGVLRGASSTAGEFGHVPLNLEGPRCACGARGCLEAYTSNPATVARYLGLELDSPDAYAELRSAGIEVGDVIDRARSGDAAATWALWETGRCLGIGIANLINSVSPAQVVVGGEITNAWNLIEPAVRESIRERALTTVSADTPLVVQPDEDRLRLRGGTSLVLAPVLRAPEVA